MQNPLSNSTQETEVSLTLEKIKAGCSELRSPLIGDILFRCRFVETFDRGIKEIIKQCRVTNDPEPEFICDPYGFKVIFKFPTSIKATVIVVEGQEDKQFVSKLQDREKRQNEIVKILEQVKEAKASEIMEKLSEFVPDRTLRSDLAALKKKNVIDSRGLSDPHEFYHALANSF